MTKTKKALEKLSDVDGRCIAKRLERATFSLLDVSFNKDHGDRFDITIPCWFDFSISATGDELPVDELSAKLLATAEELRTLAEVIVAPAMKKIRAML
jgi:hypothetical protein